MLFKSTRREAHTFLINRGFRCAGPCRHLYCNEEKEIMARVRPSKNRDGFEITTWSTAA